MSCTTIINAALSQMSLKTTSKPETVFQDLNIPDDILIEILIHLTSEPWRIPPSKTDPRIVLSQVSSRWRTLFYRYVPHAWTEIQYSNVGVIKLKKNAGKRLLQAWLPRAKTVPLSVKISVLEDWDWPWNFRGPQKELFDPLDDLVQTYSSRIRRLELNLGPSGASWMFEKMNPSSFPLLEELKCSVKGDRSWQGKGVEYPALRRLHLCRWFGVIWDLVDFSWKDLIQLQLDQPIALKHILSILRHVKHSLQDLRLTLPATDDSLPIKNKPTLRLPSLRRLTLEDSQSRTVRRTFRSDTPDKLLAVLVAPALTSLKWTGEGVGWSHSTLCELISRSSCSVESMDVKLGDIWHTLQVTGTTLKSLRIKFEDKATFPPPAMIKDLTSGKVAPQLEALHIFIYEDSELFPLFRFVDQILGHVRKRQQSSRTPESKVQKFREVAFSLPKAFLDLHQRTYESVFLSLAKLGCSARIGADEQPFWYRDATSIYS